MIRNAIIVPSPLVVPRSTSIILISESAPNLFFNALSLFINKVNISIKKPMIAIIPRYSVTFSLRYVVLLSYISIAFCIIPMPCAFLGINSIISFKPYISVSINPALDTAS